MALEGRWVLALWRACNVLMAAFFALAALVQVSPPASEAGGGRRAVGEGAGLQAPGRAGLQCRTTGIGCYVSVSP